MSCAYTISYAFLGGESAVKPFIDEKSIAFVGIFLAAILCFLFSTRFGLMTRMAGESPSLLARAGVAPDKYLLLLLACGNGIAGLGGNLQSGVLGNLNLQIGDGKLFVAIVSLVLGEGALSVLLAGVAGRAAGAATRFGDSPAIRGMYKMALLSGTGAIYPIAGALLGTLAYWTVYNLTILVTANPWQQFVLGIMTALLLFVGGRVAKSLHRFSSWTFHGMPEW